MNKLLALLVASFCLATVALADSGTVDSSEWTVERGFAAVGDLLVVRPLGVAVIVTGKQIGRAHV